MDYLSPLDASFLDAEDQDPHASLAICSVAVLDGPPPGQDEFAAMIRGRLPLVPRYRQRVHRIPFNLGRPVWVDDPDFDLDLHLRRTALPAPGGDAELANLVGRVMSQRLDREHPLWEDWIIEGLPDGRWALLSKVHHCMVDGVSGSELYRLICDTSPTPRPPVPDDWEPARGADTLDLTLDALGRLARFPFDQARIMLGAVRDAAQTGRLAGGLSSLAGAFLPVGPTALRGPLGRARRYAVARMPLADVITTAHAYEVTVNDVYLAAVSGALRRLLQARGEDPAEHPLRTLVPVSTRTRDQEGVLDNRVASLLVLLPVEIDDPVERLRAVHERILALRAAHEAEAAAGLAELADREPYAAVSLIIRGALLVPQQAITAVTTNVPGPRERLYILGRPVREILPYVPIGERLRIGVAAFTYAGQAAFGVTTDFASVPEASAIAEDLAAELAALHSTAPHGTAQHRTAQHSTARPAAPATAVPASRRRKAATPRRASVATS
ncbi:wax ester/triacylglycerol synthase family O-acyltransferase [Actinoplanes missouriensis]|uniref:wax ester/triacylglycerol synthase family O-acyltransferase n=1 Tax=Actinoplanes missouriensis TaxID=1866 RepID=UPI0033F4A5F1